MRVGDHYLTSNNQSKFKVNFMVMVWTWDFPKRNEKGRFTNQRIRNYGSSIYSIDQFLLSSDLTIYFWPIVSNTLIRKWTLLIISKEVSTPYDDLEIDLELWPVIWGQIMVADPNVKKLPLSLHTASLELSGTISKISKNWPRN
jgi:hypothetical protein